MNPARWALQNRLLCAIALVAAVVFGGIAYRQMPRFEDPEFTIRTAQVVTGYPGASAREVADEVTEALESAIQQMQEVEEIRSVSSAGRSVISVDIKFAFAPSREKLQIIWGKLRARVDDAQSALPPGALESVVNDDFGDVYGLYYLITGDGFSPRELLDYAKTVRAELLAVEGVGKVAISGAQAEAVYIEIPRERAAALGAAAERRLYDDLARQNSVAAAGEVRVGDERLAISPGGAVDSVAAIENLIVAVGDGGLARLSDFAAVRRADQTPPSHLLRFNGLPAIGLGVANVAGANVVKMGAAVSAKLAEMESRRPFGVAINEYYHQGKIVDSAVRDFAANVVLALAIVLLTLLIFMGWRAALAIGAALLVTIAATLAVMHGGGIPMHRISLGALVIALGMLVDNAIVVTEGVLVGVRAGLGKAQAAIAVVGKTKWPLLGGTLVGVIAFAPIGFAPGATAEYTGDLFRVVMISLLLSWLVAVTAAPLFAVLLFSEAPPRAAAGESGFLRRYKMLMRRVLLRRRWVIAAAAALFALSLWGARFVTPGFFPASATPQIVVDYRLPEGADISRTRADIAAIEKYLAAQEGVADVHALIGGGALRYMLVYSPQERNSAYGQLLLKVDDSRRIGDLLPVIQAHLDANYPAAQAKAWRFQLGPGGGAKIEAAFSGPDPAVLRRLAGEAKAIMAADGRAISIADDWRRQVGVIRPRYSEARGRRLGVSREELAAALQTNFSGRTVGVFRDGDDLIPIIVRAPAAERRAADSIGGVLVAARASGRLLPLTEVTDGVDTVWRDARLLRVNRVWTINVQADPAAGEAAGDLFARLRPQIESIPLPGGYALKWNGEYGDSAQANDNLAATLPLGVLAMILTVVILFNAVRQPLLIWLAAPLALIGVVAGLLLTGTALEFMAILGLLSLSGLLIKNGIVLVDEIDRQIREGKPRFDAIVDSAAGRMRPVTMGALTTVLGVLPLLTDAFFKSMAVVLVFGLGFATILTLVVVPALYAVFFGVRADERG